MSNLYFAYSVREGYKPPPTPIAHEKKSRACDACAVRKTKCQDERPCAHCVKNGLECTMVRTIKKLGPKTLRKRTLDLISGVQDTIVDDVRLQTLWVETRLGVSAATRDEHSKTAGEPEPRPVLGVAGFPAALQIPESSLSILFDVCLVAYVRSNLEYLLGTVSRYSPDQVSSSERLLALLIVWLVLHAHSDDARVARLIDSMAPHLARYYSAAASELYFVEMDNAAVETVRYNYAIACFHLAASAAILGKFHQAVAHVDLMRSHCAIVKRHMEHSNAEKTAVDTVAELEFCGSLWAAHLAIFHALPAVQRLFMAPGAVRNGIEISQLPLPFSRVYNEILRVYSESPADLQAMLPVASDLVDPASRDVAQICVWLLMDQAKLFDFPIPEESIRAVTACLTPSPKLLQLLRILTLGPRLVDFLALCVAMVDGGEHALHEAVLELGMSIRRLVLMPDDAKISAWLDGG